MGHKRPMACRWTGDDVYSRLNGSIIMYNDQAVKVSVTTSESICLFNLRSGKRVAVCSPEELDVSSPILGYMKYLDKVLYISRVPRRKYIQGLTAINVSISPLSMAKDRFKKKIMWIESKMIMSPEFADMLEGNYPTFQDCLKHRDGEIALSRDLAMKFSFSGEALVFLRQRQVGWIPSSQKRVKIRESPLIPAIIPFFEESGIPYSVVKGTSSKWLR